MKFSLRDLFWLTIVAACLTALWLARREISQLRDANVVLRLTVAKNSEAFGKQTAALDQALRKEQKLRKEVELLSQTTRAQRAQLKRREDELRDSLDRREAMVKALRIIKESPPPRNE